MGYMNSWTGYKRFSKPTSLFVKYACSLVVRTIMFGLAVFYLVTDRAQVALENVGIAHGLDYVDIAFVLILIDFVSKFSSRAKISIGSLKQYRFFQIPTISTTGGSAEELRSRIGEVIRGGMLREEQRHVHPAKAVKERFDSVRALLLDAKQDVSREIRLCMCDVDFMRALPFDESDLDVNSQAKHVLRIRRLKEVLPVAVFWVVFTVLVALVLYRFGWMSSSTVVVWMMFFFWFDMVCVVLWCPLQLIFMRNRCCVTCQIFNWDAIMVATPLIFAWSWPAALLLVVGLIILIRWEVTAFLYPERFAEETNASLTCAACTEQLCLLRGKRATCSEDKEFERAISWDKTH